MALTISRDRRVRMIVMIHLRVLHTERYEALIGLGTNCSVSRVMPISARIFPAVAWLAGANWAHSANNTRRSQFREPVTLVVCAAHGTLLR